MSIVSNDVGASGDEPVGSINVTPLIDVMCALLISFMVTIPLMSKDLIPIDIPFAAGMKLAEEDFLVEVISVDATGAAFLGVTPLSSDPAKLVEELANNVKLKESGRAFIQGDRSVKYEKIVDVLVALKAAGIADVGLISDPRLDKAGAKKP